MAKPAARIQVVSVVVLAAFAVTLGRAAQVQIGQHEQWAAEAERTRTELVELPARRGTLYDRHGTPLAVASALYHVGIASNEVREPERVLRIVARDLRGDLAKVRRALRATGQVWVHLQGPFSAIQVDSLRGMSGVYLDPVYQRSRPFRDLARPILGGLHPETGRGWGGIEEAYDSLLTGTPGQQVFLRDAGGRRYESPQRRIRDAINGHDVILTLDKGLQEIAESMLADAVQRMQADGGDAVFLDPWTGDVLAMVSRSDRGAATSAAAITSTFEPGSTAKLFTAAALLARGDFDTTLTVVVDREPYRIAGRALPISDAEPKPGVYTLAHAIEVSSNIATVKFGQMLAPAEHYAMLRRFGFGTAPGIAFPSQSRGRLELPHRWKPADEGPSMSMGYGFDATPLQLALAYGAIANGGILLAPHLVREVRDAQGRVVLRARVDTVRRVVNAETAALLLNFLGRAAGETGTGSAAQLATFRVAGKTGTSRMVVGGRYVSQYHASFAGVFPADDPQIVVVVKIDNPRGGVFYGGQTAAPVMRQMLEQALQVPQGPLDRTRLARATGTLPSAGGDAATPAPGSTDVVLLPAVARPDSARTVRIPDVTGLATRAAARELYRHGLQVSAPSPGRVVRTRPAPGAETSRGTVVVLEVQRP